MRYKYVKIVLLILFTGISLVWGQDLEQKIKNNTSKLNQIKNEIDKYRENLKEVKDKEKTLYSEVQAQKEKIILIEKKIRQLNVEIRQQELSINQLTREISNLEFKLEDLKEQYKKCIVNLYKKNKYRNLELLLTSKSINQAIYRYKYMRIFKNAEEDLSADIRTTMQKLNQSKNEKISMVEKKRNLLNDKYALKKKRKKQKEILEEKLKEARQNKQSLLAQIQEKKQALEKLKGLLANLEEKKKERQKQLERERQQRGIEESQVFSKNKGSLIWPANGSIIKDFGKIRNEQLNTVTNNPGIDISVEKGTSVRVVHDGVVSEISYIRGFGNIVIVDHGSDYYTVYAHVSNIRVFEGDYVSRNTQIAEVEQSGSLEGTVLHFEIWHKQSKLNPNRWLSNQA